VPAVILFLFLWVIVPDLASLKISARFVFLKSCAVNKKKKFSAFSFFSVWIPLQVVLPGGFCGLWGAFRGEWTSGKYRNAMAAVFTPEYERVIKIHGCDRIYITLNPAITTLMMKQSCWRRTLATTEKMKMVFNIWGLVN